MSDKYLLPQPPILKDSPVLTADHISSRPFLIVCEGYGDARFICKLLEWADIAAYNVGCPSREGLGSSIPIYLKGIRAITLGKQFFRGILVIRDANDKPGQQFTIIQQALRDANFPAPTKPFSIKGELFRVAVFLIPREGENGTLDKLLLEAALKKNPACNAV